MLRQTTCAAALVSVALAAAAPAVHAQFNLLTDLGAVAPGLGVNNSGQVVLQNHLYSNGALTPFPSGFTGTAINTGGQVAGSVGATDAQCPVVGLDRGQGCAFALFVNGAVTNFPIYDGSSGSDPSNGNQAQGLNDSGDLVGDLIIRQGLGGPIARIGGAFQSLNDPSSACQGGLQVTAGVAYGINNAGQIAGMAPLGDACFIHAFLLSQGTYTDIGVGAALALNSTGQVVGFMDFTPPSDATAALTPLHAFLYDPANAAPAQDLGTLPGTTNSFAYAINAGSLVVGSADNKRAFLYNGILIDLNSLVADGDPLKAFVTLTDARGINDSGLVVVNGMDSRTGMQHAYLLQVATIRVAPASLTFVDEPVGSTSAPQTVTFTNVGTSAIALNAATVSSNFAVLSDDCGGTQLAAAAQCAIAVTFAPTSSGNASGTLTLAAGGTPIAVSVSGMGVTTPPVAMQAVAPSSSGGGGAVDLLTLLFGGYLLASRQFLTRERARVRK